MVVVSYPKFKNFSEILLSAVRFSGAIAHNGWAKGLIVITD
jgi:hypothetical protein